MLKFLRLLINKDKGVLCEKCGRIMGTDYKYDNINKVNLPIFICKCGYWQYELGGCKLILGDKY